MVAKQANRGETVTAKPASLGLRPAARKPQGECADSRAAALRNAIVIVGSALAVGFLAFGIAWWVWKSQPEEIVPVDGVELEVQLEPEKPKLIDFQPLVDSWAKSVGGVKSVVIYDLNRDEMVGSYNVEEDYETASLYKLFVVYEGYRRVESGEWNGSATAGSTGRSIMKCLDLAIRESYSPCAETLWAMIGHDKLDEIIEKEWGITNSDISRLKSNPLDILKIMQRFYEHPDFDNEILEGVIWETFLNQPTTTYNWRQGLPSGFTNAEVYNKVGWEYNPDGRYWNIYHDAALVKFPLSDGTTRDYIVIVMSNRLDFSKIRQFGTQFENYFYENYS